MLQGEIYSHFCNPGEHGISHPVIIAVGNDVPPRPVFLSSYRLLLISSQRSLFGWHGEDMCALSSSGFAVADPGRRFFSILD